MKKGIRQLHEQFMEEAEYTSKRAKSTLEAYRNCFEVLVKLIPELTLKDFTHETITEFFKILETRKRIVGKAVKSGVKASTIETYFSKLGPFFAWLVNNKHIKTNPLKQIPRPNVNYRTRKYIKRKEIQQILSSISHGIKWTSNLIKKRNFVIIYLCLFGGLRKSEMRNLSLNDIDMDRGIITVQKETSKSNMTRQIPMTKDLKLHLQDYINERNRMRQKCHYLLVSGNGDWQLTDSGLKHVIKRIKNESGINFSLHPLRHTFSVNFLLKDGNDIAKLQQLLGHTDIRMTSGYLRCLPTEEMRKSIEMNPSSLF